MSGASDENTLVPRKAVIEDRNCWVCFLTEGEDTAAEWVRPCQCRGTTKWVHQRCLQRWVDEKQKGNSTAKVSCPQCGEEYDIAYPDLGRFISGLDYLDKIINRMCPFATTGVVIGSVYWDAVTYGSVTIMQLLGHTEGLELMERADPVFLFVGLPTIPVLLILSQMVRWEDYMLKFWRNQVQPFITVITDTPAAPRAPTGSHAVTDPISITKVLCNAMVLPSMSSFVGKLFFSGLQSTLHRTIMGGIFFVIIKGSVTLFYKQQQYTRQAYRVVQNHPENNPTYSGIKSCWVCFAKQEDDPKAIFLYPCMCRGTTQWVHQTCLQKWIDEKQRGDGLAKVTCGQCNTDYIIRVPELGPFVRILDMMQKLFNRICPFAAGGMVLGFLYWNAVTFGAVTIMQVLGHKEGLNVMESADPLFLLLGLPTIPMVLIISKMIRWEFYALSLWRKFSPSWKLFYERMTGNFRTIFERVTGRRLPRIKEKEHIAPRNLTNEETLLERISVTRVLCGVMVFPTIATLFGKLMFSSVGSNIRRTLLGGLMFQLISGVLKIFHQEKLRNRQAYRIIRDYPETKKPFLHRGTSI